MIRVLRSSGRPLLVSAIATISGSFLGAYLTKLLKKNHAELRTYGLHDNVGQFRRHFSYILETYGGMKATDYLRGHGMFSTVMTKRCFLQRCCSILCLKA